MKTRVGTIVLGNRGKQKVNKKLFFVIRILYHRIVSTALGMTLLLNVTYF